MNPRAIFSAFVLLTGTACATEPAVAPASKAAISGFDAIRPLLERGGALIVMRHATAPPGQASAVGMTAGCVLEGPRGLDAKGFAEARFIGEWLAASKIAIATVYTSDICRAYDTAILVAAGRAPVIPRAELKADDPATADLFKAELAAAWRADPRANIVLVTHSNITPLYGAGPLAGEKETPPARLHVMRDGVVLRADPGVQVTGSLVVID